MVTRLVLLRDGHIGKVHARPIITGSRGKFITVNDNNLEVAQALFNEKSINLQQKKACVEAGQVITINSSEASAHHWYISSSLAVLRMISPRNFFHGALT